jgi:hypothetical protein
MKISDLQYYDVLYNIDNLIEDDVAKLNYPQKYIQLIHNGSLHNLELISVDKDKFIVKINGKVADGVK